MKDRSVDDPEGKLRISHQQWLGYCDGYHLSGKSEVGTCGRILLATAWSLALRKGLATNEKGSNYVDFHLMLSCVHLMQYSFCSASLMLFQHLYICLAHFSLLSHVHILL